MATSAPGPEWTPKQIFELDFEPELKAQFIIINIDGHTQILCTGFKIFDNVNTKHIRKLGNFWKY